MTSPDPGVAEYILSAPIIGPVMSAWSCVSYALAATVGAGMSTASFLLVLGGIMPFTTTRLLSPNLGFSCAFIRLLLHRLP